MIRQTLPLLALAGLAACETTGITIDESGFVGDDGTGSDGGIDLPGADDTDVGGSDDPGDDPNPGDTGDDPDPGDTGDDPDPGDTGNDAPDPGPADPFDCGPYNPPTGSQLGQPSLRLAGEALVEPVDFFGNFEWSGCEVARFFRADGSLECEIVFEVEGEGGPGQGGIIYENELTLDTQATTCSGATDLVREYRVEIGFSGSNLERRVPGQRWVDYGEINTQNAGGGSFSWEYESPLFEQ